MKERQKPRWATTFISSGSVGDSINYYRRRVIHLRPAMDLHDGGPTSEMSGYMYWCSGIPLLQKPIGTAEYSEKTLETHLKISPGDGGKRRSDETDPS